MAVQARRVGCAACIVRPRGRRGSAATHLNTLGLKAAVVGPAATEAQRAVAGPGGVFECGSVARLGGSGHGRPP